MKRISTRTIIAAVTLATGLTGAGVAVASRAWRGDSSARATGTTRTAPILPLGRQLTWAVSLQARMRQPGSPDGGAAPEQITTLGGDLTTTVSGATEDAYDLAFELRQPEVQGQGFGKIAPEELTRLKEKLGRRFWVSYQREGAARELHFPRDLTPDIRNLLTLLVTNLQIVRPTVASPQWNATERDSAGAYLAMYRQPSPTELSKQKLRYLQTDGNSPASSAALQVDDAQSHFTLDSNGLVTQAEIHERSHLTPKVGLPGFELELRIVLGKPRLGTAPSLVGSLERAQPTLDTSPITTQLESEDVLRARHDAELIQGVTLVPLLSQLRGRSNDARLRAQLAALLRQRTGDVKAALDFARQADDETAQVVLAALGSAQTPEAQDALGVLATDVALSSNLRRGAILSLIQTRHPTPSTLSWLLGLLDDPEPAVAKQALYLTGAAGAACRDRDYDPAGATRVEAELLRRFHSCREGVCPDVLIALGNLASNGTLPTIQEALRSPDLHTRAAAVSALSRFTLPSADRLIAATMIGDREPQVRAAAVTAVGSRLIAPLAEQLANLLLTDRSEAVRSAAINVASRHIGEAPQLEQALLTASTSDTSPSLRKLAKQALGARSDSK